MYNDHGHNTDAHDFARLRSSEQSIDITIKKYAHESVKFKQVECNHIRFILIMYLRMAHNIPRYKRWF